MCYNKGHCFSIYYIYIPDDMTCTSHLACTYYVSQ